MFIRAGKKPFVFVSFGMRELCHPIGGWAMIPVGSDGVSQFIGEFHFSPLVKGRNRRTIFYLSSLIFSVFSFSKENTDKDGGEYSWAGSAFMYDITQGSDGVSCLRLG